MYLAIMQPYFFPYIGYFQLINKVNHFIFLDDVNFIKKGWINRNRILINGQSKFINVPLKNISQNRKIYEHSIDHSTHWQRKLVQSISLSYKRAPFFNQIFPIIEDLVQINEDLISTYNRHIITRICEYLGINTKFTMSSEYSNNNLKGQERILDLCIQENTETYINLSGGKSLYSSREFQEKQMDLLFLSASEEIKYTQFDDKFLPNLSIIDVLMFNSKEQVQHLLTQCTLQNN